MAEYRSPNLNHITVPNPTTDNFIKIFFTCALIFIEVDRFESNDSTRYVYTARSENYENTDSPLPLFEKSTI